MTFIMEAVIICLLFHLLVYRSLLKDPLQWVEDYPPAIAARVRELGLIPPVKSARSRGFIIQKTIKALVISVVMALIVVFVNHAETFRDGFLISYGLWLIVTWYDAFIMDCLCFAHDKRAMIPGTEDMVNEYHNYLFHIKMSGIGTLLGLPACALAGVLTVLLNMI